MDPADEIKRLDELRRLLILDTAPEQAFDDLTRMAAEVCFAPLALITLVDGDRQWFKSKVGLAVDQTPRAWAFCSHAIEKPNEVMVVNDATKDPRFKTNPLVTGEPNIRFYAGAPLITASRNSIGTICVIDTKPRVLSNESREMLLFLARQVIEVIERRSKS